MTFTYSHKNGFDKLTILADKNVCVEVLFKSGAAYAVYLGLAEFEPWEDWQNGVYVFINGKRYSLCEITAQAEIDYPVMIAEIEAERESEWRHEMETRAYYAGGRS